jgi:hypothetical protein
VSLKCRWTEEAWTTTRERDRTDFASTSDEECKANANIPADASLQPRDARMWPTRSMRHPLPSIACPCRIVPRTSILRGCAGCGQPIISLGACHAAHRETARTPLVNSLPLDYDRGGAPEHRLSGPGGGFSTGNYITATIARCGFRDSSAECDIPCELSRNAFVKGRSMWRLSVTAERL